ncbi:MAG: hypothetical protein R3Y46_07675 [Opitutales bacterium]
MKNFKKILKTLILATLATVTFGLNAAPKIAISTYPWKKNTFSKMLNDIKDSDVEGIFAFQNIKIGGEGANAETNFSYKMSEAAQKELQAMLDKYNKKIKGIGHVKLTNPSQIEDMFKFCKKMGIEVMTIEAPLEVLKIYDEMAIKYGIDGGLYNHPQNTAPYQTSAKALEGIKDLKKIKVFPDTGQYGRAKIDIIKSLNEITPKNVIAVSLQDLDAKGGCEEFGKGKLPLKDFVSTLNKAGFDGYYIVMFASLPQAAKVLPSVEYLKSIK